MSPREVLVAVGAALPLAVGWSVHGLFLRRRIESARRDPLTGLRGREAFEDRAAKLLRAGGPCGAVVVDLDGFKALNDTVGHAAGDAALRAVGCCLVHWNRRLGGVVARLGGDEFAAVVPARTAEELSGGLRRLHTLVCRPVKFEGRPVALGASIGAVWHDGRGGVDLSVLLRRADEAMYTAKRAGGGWYVTEGLQPVHATVNGRRMGRLGTAAGSEALA